MIIPAIIHIPWVCISVIDFLRKGSILGSSYLSEAGSVHATYLFKHLQWLSKYYENRIKALYLFRFSLFPFFVPSGLIITSDKFLCFPDWVNYLKYILCNLPLSVYLSPGCSELKFYFLHEISPSSPPACHYQCK